jgi:hypothetical protein
VNKVRLPLVLVILASTIVLLCSCGSQPSPSAPSDGFMAYFGMAEPGLSPQRFAPGILPPDGAVMHSAPAFSPDGTEACFSAYSPDKQPRLDVIMFMQWQGSAWSSPQVAVFSGEFNDNWPWFSPDGNRIYFSSQRPHDGQGEAAGEDGMWYVGRKEGGWTSARSIDSPADFGRDEGPIYVAANLAGGYGDMDLYRLEYVGGTYSMPENLGPAVNTPAEEYAPCAAQDESYLVFTRFEQAGERRVGLYVTFRKADGTWSEAQSMGDRIVAFEGARFPRLSPDGKHLFFVPAGGEAVYWVDAGVVEQFRPAQ